MHVDEPKMKKKRKDKTNKKLKQKFQNEIEKCIFISCSLRVVEINKTEMKLKARHSIRTIHVCVYTQHTKQHTK